MKFPLSVPGMDGHIIEVTTASLGRPPQLLIDSLPAPTGPHKGEWLIYRPDGTLATVTLTGQPFDIVPKVSVNGQDIALAPPLQPHEWVLICLPLVLLFLSLIGAVFGALAAIINVFLVRSSAPDHVRSLSALGVAFLAFAIVLPATLVMRRDEPDSAASQPLFRPHPHHHKPHKKPVAPPADVPASSTPDAAPAGATQ